MTKKRERNWLFSDWVLRKGPHQPKLHFTRHYRPSWAFYMHIWMWHLRQRECHERFWMPDSPFLSNETTTFLNISRKWKPPNAIHCWCTKTDEKKIREFIVTYLKDPTFNCCLFWDRGVVSAAKPQVRAIKIFLCDNQTLKKLINQLFLLISTRYLAQTQVKYHTTVVWKYTKLEQDDIILCSNWNICIVNISV